MRVIIASLLTSLLLESALTASAGSDGVWPSFRGPNASGVSETAKPPVEFGPEKNVQWKTEVPWSPSSPVVWGDRLFLTTFADGKLETRAYRVSNGELLWRQGISVPALEEFHGTEGSPAASTPATDGRHVVSYFGSFGLICYDVQGKERWRHPLSVATTAGNFGSGTSPLIVGDQVILNRDVTVEPSLLALSLSTGNVLWETPRTGNITSYGSPILWEHPGGRELVMSGSLVMRGYDLKTGKELWNLKGMPSYTCTTPVVGNGLLFFAGWSPGKADAPRPSWETMLERQDKNHDGVISSTEYADGLVWFKAMDIDRDGLLTKKDWDAIQNQMAKGENVLLAVKPGGRGELDENHVAWKFTKGLPYVPSVLSYRDRVYMVKDGGLFSSFDALSGKPFYSLERLQASGAYYASPVAADGRIYLASLDGVVTVVRAGGDQPERLHQVKFGEKIAGTPALVGDRLYLRTQTRLFAFGLK